LAELGRGPDEVRDIVITHADGDHIGGLSALVDQCGATVWAGEAEADVIEGLAPHRNGEIARSGTVDRRFRPGETIPVHDGIQTVDTHGHTAGHVAYHLPDEQVLIAGDCLNNRSGLSGSAPEYTADPVEARKAVRAVAALRPDIVVFGHGPSIVGDAARQLDELDRSLG
jgi:glyoxylase-like metal-dependent hydrolase (beta-lactamase superfamily II)